MTHPVAGPQRRAGAHPAAGNAADTADERR
jgi:hypothetical protein